MEMSSPSVLIDTELLIKAVKRHPALYKKSDPSYFHKSNHKPKIWQEVCREVIPNWDSLKPQDRVGFVYLSQKRWKNLRTCFGREIQLQKQEALQRKQKIAVKPRKVYGYYKKLSFILEDEDDDGDEEEVDKTDENSDDDYDTNVNLKIENYDMEQDDSIGLEADTFVQAFEPIRSKEKKYVTNETQSSDGKVIDYLKSVKKDLKKEEEDEDKQFLLSLIPTFRKLNDKQKFEARIEILKVLKVFQVQKRWKNLRTCFGRELHLQKQEALQRKQNIAVKPRKVYGYYKKLSFILEDEDGDEEDVKTDDNSDDDYDPLVNLKTENYEMEHEVALELAPDTYVQAFEPIRSKEKTYVTNETQRTDGKVIDYLKNVKKDLKKDEEDEDKQFLMSLLHTFRKLDDKQKFEARIEILKVLKDISFQSDAGPSC